MFEYIAAATLFLQPPPAGTQAPESLDGEAAEIAALCGPGKACAGEVRNIPLSSSAYNPASGGSNYMCATSCSAEAPTGRMLDDSLRALGERPHLSTRGYALTNDRSSVSPLSSISPLHDIVSMGERPSAVDLCRFSRSQVSGVTSGAVDRWFRQANYPLYLRDASDSLQLFVGQGPSRQPGEKARYQVRVDLTAIPIDPPVPGACAVRIEARLWSRIPPSPWHSERDDFSVRLADEVYRKLMTLAH